DLVTGVQTCALPILSQNDCPNIATCRQPFPVVSADRPPARRFIVPNPICNQPGKTLDLCTRDGDRLLSVNFLQVLDPTFGEVDRSEERRVGKGGRRG